MRRPQTPAGLAEYWRIEEMELWRTEYLDLIVPAFIEFGDNQMGQFQFGAVAGWLDCRFGEHRGLSAVEFSWEGQNDLEGRIYIHRGGRLAVRGFQKRSTRAPGST